MSDITFFILSVVACGVLGILVGTLVTLMHWMLEDKKDLLELIELSNGLDKIHTGLEDIRTELNKGE